MADAADSSRRLDLIALARDNWERSGWASTADAMAFVTSIVRVQQVFLSRIETLLRPFDLSFARFEVLRLLAFTRSGTMPIGKVGERLQVHPASVTNAVHRLERDGFVERRPNPDDGRSVLVSITQAGCELTERCTQLLNDEVFAVVPLEDDQLTEGFELLRGVRDAFGDFDAAADS